MSPRSTELFIILTLVSCSAALYCLSCTDSVSPRHCHTVRKCSDGEVCFTESHTTENGAIVYDTGCATSQTCRTKRAHPNKLKSLHGVDPHYHHSQCMECCTSHLCNNQGCGQPGYPMTRGPACFDCQQVSDPMLCDKIKICEMNQVCYLQKEIEFGDVLFTSSCINKHACTSDVDVFGKRNLQSCSRCCLADLCNNECGDMTYSSFTSPSSLASTTTVTPSTTQASRSLGSRGNEFLILFMRNFYLTGNLRIYITTDNESEVWIRSSQDLNAKIKSSVDRTINITSDSLVTLPSSLTCEYMKIEPKGLILKTSELSTVTVFDSLYKDTNDGTLIIPTDKLSTKYFVSSTEPYDAYWDVSQFAFGALYDKTTVNVLFKMNNDSSINLFGRSYRSGDVFSITLQGLETLQIRHTSDLSGTFITSTKMIAVFSGNRCQRLGMRPGCDHMVTQLPPINELDYQYIVPPFYNSSGTVIQVISENMTFVNYSTGNNTSRFSLNEKEFKNLTVSSNKTTVLVSEKPILVTGFAMGSDKYDCYMTVIPGVNQFVDYYKITVPDGYTENFITVIHPIKSTNYLRINGKTADNYRQIYQNYAVLQTTFNIRTFEVQKGTYIVATTDGSELALIVYGHRSGDGYGFAGNFVLP